MIQFCRYAMLAVAAGARVILAVQPALRDVIASLGHGISVVAAPARAIRCDYHCPLLSLPHAFATTETSVPAPGAYLHAEAALTSAWRRRLDEDGFRIGVCWQGATERQALQRSFPLRLLHKIAAIEGVRLISLQTGAGIEQLDELPAGMTIERYDTAPDAGGLRPFIDTAAMIANLDLVISLDSAIAHLAGAMGRPVWIALKAAADWRWGQGGDITPWYPSARLFRQSVRSEWEPVFAAMRTALLAKLA